MVVDQTLLMISNAKFVKAVLGLKAFTCDWHPGAQPLERQVMPVVVLRPVLILSIGFAEVDVVHSLEFI